MRDRDGLPEHATYVDEGCDLWEHCMSCPLPKCRYEMEPGKARSLLMAAALDRMLHAGVTLDGAAVILGVSRRTIFRLRLVGNQLFLRGDDDGAASPIHRSQRPDPEPDPRSAEQQQRDLAEALRGVRRQHHERDQADRPA